MLPVLLGDVADGSPGSDQVAGEWVALAKSPAVEMQDDLDRLVGLELVRNENDRHMARRFLGLVALVAGVVAVLRPEVVDSVLEAAHLEPGDPGLLNVGLRLRVVDSLERAHEAADGAVASRRDEVEQLWTAPRSLGRSRIASSVTVQRNRLGSRSRHRARIVAGLPHWINPGAKVPTPA